MAELKKTLVLGASPNPSRISFKAVNNLVRAGHPVVAVGQRVGNIGNIAIAIDNYKGNILISKSIYPLLAILEIGLRNSINYQLTKKFNDRVWYENNDFVKIAANFQIDRISQARTNIYLEKKEDNKFQVLTGL
jgi:hypothetical protein